MKKALAAALGAGILMAAGPGSAATPLERRVATLQKQVTTLQKQVKTLQKQSKDNEEVGLSSLGLAICLTAVTGDSFQGTWSAVNQVAGRSVFPAAAVTLNDRGICNALRVPRQSTTAPTIAPFSALLALLGPAALLESMVAAP